MCRCRINKALLSISVRLLCSFSVSSLTLRRSSSSAFRNSLSPTACSLRWLCSASSASSSLTRPRRAWHNRPLWRRTGERGKRSYVLWGCCSDKVRKKSCCFYLQSERLQLLFEGLDLPRQLLDQPVSVINITDKNESNLILQDCC